jgi:HicB-like protein involved in pilus formation
MRNSNFALRLQTSLMEEAKELAKAEGVALNQLINVAVAEKLAANRTAAFLDRFTQGHNVEAALGLLGRHRTGEPARSGDELPDGWTLEQMEKTIADKRRRTRGEPRKRRAGRPRPG